jgi:hypothetical protein
MLGVSDGVIDLEGIWLGITLGLNEGLVEGMFDGDTDGNMEVWMPPPQAQQANFGPSPENAHGQKLPSKSIFLQVILVFSSYHDSSLLQLVGLELIDGKLDLLGRKDGKELGYAIGDWLGMPLGLELGNSQTLNS